MTLIKTWNRASRWSPLIGHFHYGYPPRRVGSTSGDLPTSKLLRTIFDCQVTVNFGAIGAPAEYWWTTAQFDVMARWGDGAAPPAADPADSGRLVIANAVMVPTFFPAAGGGGSYYVTWRLREPLDITTSRDPSVGNTAASQVAFDVQYQDGGFFALQSTSFTPNISIASRYDVLFGD